MTAPILALLLAGAPLVLQFDGPIVLTQRAAASPPRLVLEVQGGALPEGEAARARAAGLTLDPGCPPGVGAGTHTGPQGCVRLTLALPADATAWAEAAGATLTIRIDEAEPPALLLAASPAGHPAQGGVAVPPAPLGDDDLIGPEDLLEVNVFELPELRTTTRVLGDGTVSLPLLGVVQAAGLTRTGLEARLSELLEARFIQDPQVTVAVTEHRSRLVSVIGAVTKPGTYSMIGPRTLLQMISEAGGLTREAGADIVILRRREPGEPGSGEAPGAERLQIDLERLVEAGDPALNVPLYPGDVVNIPIDRPVYVYVDGAVRNPGQVEGRLSRVMTLLQAVARTGGLTERANLRGVHVLRKGADGKQVRMPVNLRDIRKGKSDDIVLQDGDVVVVPETFF